MKIVNIIYSGLGGHSSVVFALIEGDHSSKNEHSIIFFGVECVPLGYIDKCKELGVEYFSVLKKPGIDIVSIKNVVCVLAKLKPKVIILHTVNLILPVSKYSFKNQIKLIAVEHQANELKLKKDWVYSILSMLLSDKVVYLTEIYKDQMKKTLGWVFKKKKVSVINNGINLLVYKPSNLSYNDKINIGMLSRLMPTKDHQTLIYSFSELLKQNTFKKKIVLNIAGDGSTKDNLKGLVKKLKIEDSVNFLGMIPENDSVDFLNSQNIYVHVSQGETMSTAIMQAMACNKAIVASDVEGINNMLENKVTALLIPPKNRIKLTEAFILLIENDVLRKKISKNALEYANQHFSNDIMFQKYCKLFN